MSVVTMLRRTASIRASGRVLPGLASPAGRGGVRSMGVHKNKYCEEWYNLRDDSYKAWKFDSSTTPRFIMAVPVSFIALYALFKAENEKLEDIAVQNGTHDNRVIKPVKTLKVL